MLTGRADDVLLLVNGEKASPAPLEASLRTHPDIADALVFGASQAVLGVAIVPTKAESDKKNLLEALAQANKQAPAHAQISPELLLLLPQDTQLPRASKGSLQRGRAYDAYASEISQIYAAYGRSTLDSDRHSAGKSKMEGKELLDFISRIVKETMGIDSIDPDEDLFSSGLNSLQSVRVRNLLQKVGSDFPKYTFEFNRLTTEGYRSST